MADESLFVVLSDWCAGREQNFHQWYEAHVDDILAAPGWRMAQRYRRVTTDAYPSDKWRHLAVYEITGRVHAAFTALDKSMASTPPAAGSHDGILKPGYTSWAFEADRGKRITSHETSIDGPVVLSLMFYSVRLDRSKEFATFYDDELTRVGRDLGIVSTQTFNFQDRARTHGYAEPLWPHLLACEFAWQTSPDAVDQIINAVGPSLAQVVDPGYALWAFAPIGSPHVAEPGI